MAVERASSSAWRTERRASRRFFMTLMAIAAVATCWLFFPLAPVLLFAAVLAAAMSPLYERFVSLLRGRRLTGAILFAVGFILVVLVPLTLATISVVGDIMKSAQNLTAHMSTDGGI